MDEVSARAMLVSAAEAVPGFTLTVPRSEVEEALQAPEGEAELLLDVVRATNGHRDERRIAVAWERSDLEELVREARGERVTLAIDPASLEHAFDAEVEAHGIREAALALSIVAATAVGGAQAAVDPLGGPASSGTSDPYAQIESVRAQSPAADPAAGIEGVRAARQAPEATDPAAGIEGLRAARQAPEATADAYAGIERVRSTPAAPDPDSAIENVRVGGSIEGDPYAAIETTRAGRAAPVSGDDGITITAPSAGEAAALAGAAALTIVGAAFALRRRREPRPA
jgi:hypothetical protein